MKTFKNRKKVNSQSVVYFILTVVDDNSYSTKYAVQAYTKISIDLIIYNILHKQRRDVDTVSYEYETVSKEQFISLTHKDVDLFLYESYVI